MEPAGKVEIDGRQMENAEIARHAGGLADVDFMKVVGHPGQRRRQQLSPGPAGAAVRCAEKHDGDAGRGGEAAVELALSKA